MGLMIDGGNLGRAWIIVLDCISIDSIEDIDGRIGWDRFDRISIDSISMDRISMDRIGIIGDDVLMIRCWD